MVILSTLLVYLLSNVADGFGVGGLTNMARALAGLALNEQMASMVENK